MAASRTGRGFGWSIISIQPVLGLVPASSKARAVLTKASERVRSSLRYREKQRYVSASQPRGPPFAMALEESRAGKARTVGSSARIADVYMLHAPTGRYR